MNRINTVLESEYIEQDYTTNEILESFDTICSEECKTSLYLSARRILDLVLSLVVSVPIAIVVLITGIFVKLDSNGPILFKQERAGKNGKAFTIYKIRTMSHAPLDETRDMVWTEKDDCRITRVGKVIRKVRLDELPQIINVIKGDMSFVGPRPETVVLTEKFNESIPDFNKRLMVQPGITGLAQVNGGYDLSAEEKIVFDLQYIENVCFWEDIKILFSTVKVIFMREGAR